MDWNKDGTAIIYNAYKQEGVTDGSETTANKNQLLFYHKLGDKQEDDTQIGCYPRNSFFFSREIVKGLLCSITFQLTHKLFDIIPNKYSELLSF